LLGHEARSALTGREAIASAEDWDPAVVILDLGLPDLSGYEVARALRARRSRTPLYIAALTGWTQSRDRTRSIAAGIDQYIAKPASADKLRAILDAASTARTDRSVAADPA
jgi:DNA-binding response OmpR family regulator